MEMRLRKALEIIATRPPTPRDTTPPKGARGGSRWAVHSQTGVNSYTVRLYNGASQGNGKCTCLDHTTRNVVCKHLLAVEITAHREVYTKSDEVTVAYTQDWTTYNAAQVEEKERFLQLLSGLCADVGNPIYTIGRPRLAMADMVFAMVFKMYAGLSSRRFCSDLREMAGKGLIDRAPHFNSLTNYMRDPAVTSVLTDLIAVTARPLAKVETKFAIDSSGFSAGKTFEWFSKKHGRTLQRRDWVKLHAITGVQTNIITEAKVTDGSAHDSPYFEGLVRATAENFTVREVLADKAYLSQYNLELVDEVGGTPYVPFKVNSVRPESTTSMWGLMYHYFALQQATFMRHYHQRSNVETTFSMIKRKFGENLYEKSFQGHVNEVLSKVVAHNLCVVTAAHHELGIDPAFTYAPALSA